MYFLSGEATCLKVMWAGAVMSAKTIVLPWPSTRREGMTKSRDSKTGRGQILLSCKLITPSLWGGLTPLFLFELLGDFQLAFALSLAARCQIRSAELIVHVRFDRFEPGRGFQTF